ncbi:uncharacterized protein NP_6006A (plasmid) [Natronomonas pharaonis DSM 2160]|uniref:Uncharacterized protein n=1 Tax=Natronomonas pharaonis (strain ATCC 35678 / DSM 2160 / CIP 103997 / JCM 8858 / NBRC 14720 / NCIMB 2260 / Gabara) TaxID=348780 RepID=Q3IM76_NATPD|nr:hypothetical protein [Natronomonas pharaonis]CAI50783.1 uncharacterized protein NP_6006A [Natronomonas pharaonis DSM 2160]
MSVERVREELLAGGLHKESLERLLDHYESMSNRFSEGEFAEAGTHIGNFCENMVNILLDQMGEEVQKRPNVDYFVNKCLSNGIGNDEPDSVRLQIPRVIRAAYDIRNNRDSVHVNLKVPVNRADTQAGIAMCSWMLAEILRVYGNGTDNMGEIAGLIDEISEPADDKNPLEDLAQSPDEFDRQALADQLSGVVQITEGTVHPITGSDYEELSTTGQVIVLLLGHRAAVDISYVENAGASVPDLSEETDVSDERVRQIIRDFGFIQAGNASGEYMIPGHRVGEALKQLSLG